MNSPWEIYWSRKSVTTSPGLPYVVVRNGLWSFCWVIKSPSSESENPLSLSFFFPHVHVRTQIHTHTSTQSALGNQKQTVLNCKPCRLLESPCHLFVSQMFIISSQVCGCKTKGTLGTNKFPCQNSITNLAGVTFSQISAPLMFLSMPQFSQIVSLKCKIEYITCIVY